MSKRILVVEDQPDNRQIIRDMLAGTDYEITEAENGGHARAPGCRRRHGAAARPACARGGSARSHTRSGGGAPAARRGAAHLVGGVADTVLRLQAVAAAERNAPG